MNFNPRFPRGKRQHAYIGIWNWNNISIHASRGGSDFTRVVLDVSLTNISIHASRGGSDFKVGQNTGDIMNFNPRFPRGKRLNAFFYLAMSNTISIHASRGGSDKAVGRKQT